MKKNINLVALVVFLLAITNANSQNDKTDTTILNTTVKWGVNATFSADNYFYAVQPNLVLNFKKNTFLISPKFTFHTEVPSNNFIKGFNFSYKRFPNPKAKHLDFYFIADIAYTKNMHSEQKNYIDNGNSYSSTYKHSLNYWGFNIGYGFIYKIKNIYLDQSIGFGLGLYSEDYNLNVPDFPTASYNEKGTNGLDFAKLYKIGIGYNF